METKDFCYVEYRVQPFRQKDEAPRMVRTDDPILLDGGFRSVYQVTLEGKAWVEERGTIAGFGESGIPVWSPKLVVDFDECPEEAEYFKSLLVHDGVGFEEYTSGNRSVHFHVSREIEPSPNVPYSDKQYIKAVAPKADLSIYSALHPFRLSGTVHEKTGLPKVIVDVVEGGALRIPLATQPDYSEAIARVKNVSIFEDPLIMGLSRGFREGSRYKHMLVLAYKLRERGEEPGFIRGWLQSVNKLNFPPLPDERLSRIFRSVLNGSGDEREHD